MRAKETKQLKLLFYVFILSLGACHPGGSPMKEIQTAKSMMEENPDTALYILERIADVEQLQGEDYATYCLLRTKADELNNIPHTSDSLISIAADYFKDVDRPYMKAKAYYYLARVNEDMSKDSLAIQNYQVAIAAIEKTKRYKEAALIYTHLSKAYQRAERYNDALDMQQKAYNNRLMAGNEKTNSSWSVIITASFIICILLFQLWRNKKNVSKKDIQLGKQERQINAAKQTTIEQKAEINDLKREIRAVKRAIFNSSEVTQKIQAINNLKLADKEKPDITEGEWNAYLSLLEDAFGFVSHLQRNYPKLSDTDIRICALLREGIMLPHIESVMGMSHETLTRRMLRIKSEKLGMGGQNNTLETIMRGLCA